MLVNDIRWEQPVVNKVDEVYRQSLANLDNSSANLFKSLEGRLIARSAEFKEHHTIATYVSLKEASRIAENNPPDLSYERERAVHELASALERGEGTGNNGKT